MLTPASRNTSATEARRTRKRSLTQVPRPDRLSLCACWGRSLPHPSALCLPLHRAEIIIKHKDTSRQLPHSTIPGTTATTVTIGNTGGSGVTQLEGIWDSLFSQPHINFLYSPSFFLYIQLSFF